MSKSILFGLSAIVVGALSLLLSAVGQPELFTWPWQLVIFALIAVATVFWVRRFYRAGTAHTDQPDLNVRANQYVGRSLIVEQAILNGRGKVRVGDTLWPVEGPDTPAGAEVKVTAAKGTVLVVERV